MMNINNNVKIVIKIVKHVLTSMKNPVFFVMKVLKQTLILINVLIQITLMTQEVKIYLKIFIIIYIIIIIININL